MPRSERESLSSLNRSLLEGVVSWHGMIDSGWREVARLWALEGVKEQAASSSPASVPLDAGEEVVCTAMDLAEGPSIPADREEKAEKVEGGNSVPAMAVPASRQEESVTAPPQEKSGVARNRGRRKAAPAAKGE